MDAQAWLSQYGTISDVRGNLINSDSTPPLKLNILQRRIAAVYAHAKSTQSPCRVIGLKPRKKGFSTMVGAIHYHQLRSNRHEGLIIGDQFETSDTVFRMEQTYLDNDKMPWGNTGSYNTERIKFSNGSIIHQRTAKNKNTARGMTPQFAHGTEVAHWQNAEPVLVAVMNAIDSSVFNAVFLESTPNGAQGPFFDTWENARWPNDNECPMGQEGYYKQWSVMSPGADGDPIFGDSGFVRVFAAWFEFDDSFTRLNDEQKIYIENTLDAEEWYRGEKELMATYLVERKNGVKTLGKEVEGCDVWEQLAWRRQTIKTKCSMNPNTFDQEYPKDANSCFLASGSKYFDSWALAEFVSGVRDPDYGTISVQEGARGGTGGAVWMPTDKDTAPFMRWEHPILGASYLVSVDPAVGVDQTSSRNDDPDQHSCLVWRRAFRDQNGVYYKPALVARVSHGDPGSYPIATAAELVNLLSIYYGRAITVVEMNNSGLAFITCLQTLGTPLYYREEYDPNKAGAKRRMVGWQTSDTANYGGIRTQILEMLHQLVRENSINIWDKHLIAELGAFIRHPNGKLAAANGKHDDDVMSAAIGLRCLDSASVYAEVPVTRKMPSDLAAQLKAAEAPKTATTW